MKTMSRDSQIILNIMRYQDKIDAVISSVDDESDVVNDKEKVELLTFYILKIFAMRKNFSGKTKKALTCFDDTKGNMVLSGMISVLYSMHLGHCISGITITSFVYVFI